MGTTLTGNKVKDTYKSLIKITDSTEAGSSAKQLSDGNGNDLGLYVDTDGVFGIGAPANVSLDISSATDAIGLPVGTTANRPTGSAGQMRYNSTTGDFELYDTGWTEIFTTDGGTVSGDVTITGDLIVQGTTVTLNTETIEFEDNILQLNTTQGSPDTATGVVSGISIYRGDGVTQASFLFDDADDTWDLTNNLVVDGNLTVDAITGATVNVEGDFAVNTNDLFVKSTSSYVALGHTAPLYPLHIINSNGNIFKASSSDTIVNMFLENNTQRVDLYSNRGSAAIQVDQNNESGAYDSTFAITIDNNSYFKIHTDGKVEVQDGDFVVDTNSLYVDSANNFVGIGTTNQTTNGEKLRIAGDLFINSLGSATVPSIAIGDTNSGIYASAAGQISITTQGNQRLNIDGSGNIAMNTDTLYVDSANNRVGIGTTSPDNRIHIKGDTDATSSIKLEKSGSSTAVLTSYYIGTTTSDDFRFLTNFAEKMRITSSGNVGIGTDSPATNLHISSAASIPIARIESTHPSGIPFLDLKGAASSQIRYLDETGTVQTRIDMSDGGGFSFVDVAGSGSSRMMIDSSGRVGIGESNPTSELHITDSAANAFVRLESSSTGVAGVAFGDADLANECRIIYDNSDDSLRFNVNNDTERMRITSGGDVLVQAQSVSAAGLSIIPNATAGTVQQIFNRASTTSTSYIFDFQNAGTTVGYISYDNTSTNYNTSSDYRLKENVVPMEGALDRVDALKPSRFNFIADADKTVDGFLAHEVAEVVPEAISGEKDAVDEDGNAIYQGIDQSKLVPLLVGAIQELKAEIETLKSQIQ
jgi:hypothetical protein